jgi:hypothetical protein
MRKIIIICISIFLSSFATKAQLKEFNLSKEKQQGISLNIGSELTIKFNGSCIGLSIAAGEECGIIECIIDNNLPFELNMFDVYCGRSYRIKHVFVTGKLENCNHIFHENCINRNIILAKNFSS